LLKDYARVGANLRPQARGFPRHRRRHGNGRAAGHPRAGLATLDLYCDRVASAVGRLSVRVFGLPEDDGILLAHHLGRALQLTNILRDIDEDAGDRPALSAARRAAARRHHQRRSAEGDRRPALPKSARRWRAGAGAFRQGRRDHEPQFAAHGARAADHVEILSRDPGLLVARGFAPPRAPVRLNKMARIAILLRYASSDAKTVHIIGAGISGLSAAVRLANAGNYKVHVHEATQQAGGRCRSYFDAATNLTIDNGNHLLLSGNHHALAYARSIGTEAGLVGPKRAQFPFVDLCHRPALAARSRRRPAAALGVRRGAPRPRHRACSTISR
jgi:hypothetical protein